jgi:hypothetical protein
LTLLRYKLNYFCSAQQFAAKQKLLAYLLVVCYVYKPLAKYIKMTVKFALDVWCDWRDMYALRELMLAGIDESAYDWSYMSSGVSAVFNMREDAEKALANAKAIKTATSDPDDYDDEDDWRDDDVPSGDVQVRNLYTDVEIDEREVWV